MVLWDQVVNMSLATSLVCSLLMLTVVNSAVVNDCSSAPMVSGNSHDSIMHHSKLTPIANTRLVPSKCVPDRVRISGLGVMTYQCAQGTEACVRGAGWNALQRYNSLPVPRPRRVSVEGRGDRKQPLPNLDEFMPSGSGTSNPLKWARMRKQLK